MRVWPHPGCGWGNHEDCGCPAVFDHRALFLCCGRCRSKHMATESQPAHTKAKWSSWLRCRIGVCRCTGRLLRVRLEQDVEHWLPGLAAVQRARRGFAHVFALPIPDAAQQRRLAFPGALLPGEHHAIAFHAATQQQQFAAIGHPALVPGLARAVIEAVTLAVQSVVLAIILMDHATIEDDVDL